MSRFGIGKLADPTLAELTLAWHKLDAWPDVGPAFARLHKRFLMAPCSNGNIALMADVGRPGEGGPGTGKAAPKGSFDVVGKNFNDFADKLGV